MHSEQSKNEINKLSFIKPSKIIKHLGINNKKV